MKLVGAVLVVLGNCCLALAAQAQTSQVHFGHLAMQWPAGYTVLRPADPVLLQGPAGQDVAVSVTMAPADPDARAEAAAGQRSFAVRSARLMRSAAASHGRVVRTTRSVLPDGSTLLATASQGRRGADGYLLQFTVLATKGHVGYLTVQGKGRDATAEYRRLVPLFQSVHWVPDVQVAGE